MRNAVANVELQLVSSTLWMQHEHLTAFCRMIDPTVFVYNCTLTKKWWAVIEFVNIYYV